MVVIMDEKGIIDTMNESIVGNTSLLTKSFQDHDEAMAYFGDNYSLLDTGNESYVYSDGSKVWKIVFPGITANLPFYEFCQHNSNPHLPTVYLAKKYNDFLIIEMALLEELDYDLATVISDYCSAVFYKEDVSAIDISSLPDNYKAQLNELCQWFDKISKMTPGTLDFNPSNIMLRGDSLVLNDPIRAIDHQE